MMNTHYRFKIGDFDCMSVSDGGMNYPVGSFAKGYSREQIESLLREFGLPATHIHSPYTLLYVDTGQHKVMVDTGVGRLGKTIKESPLFAEVDNSGVESGIVVQSLRVAGIDPAEIDTVIITHMHGDHIGGNLDQHGALNFPNAQYYVSQAEWDFWFDDGMTADGGMPESFVKIARDNMTPLRDRLTFIAPDAEIVPGIIAIPAPGHTPGHIALLVASGNDELIHLVDAAVHPMHLKYPDILLPFDILPEQTIVTRRQLCDRAAASDALVFGHHLPPFPGLGHIIRQGDHRAWEPIAVAERG